MRRVVVIMLALLSVAVMAGAQSQQVNSSGTLPSSCVYTSTRVSYYYRSGSTAPGWYVCSSGGTWVLAAVNAASSTRTIGCTVDGGTAVVTTGAKCYVQVSYSGTITGVTVLSTDAAVTSGSAVWDIWRDTYSAYPPTVADTITAAAKPTLSAATKYTDSTLSGWTKTFAAGDVFAFKVDSASTVTRMTILLQVQP
jgi:hypothetical protein